MNTQNIFFKTARQCLYAGLSIVFTSLTLLSTNVYADDTAVFLGTSSGASTATRPNILFIIDTSGSMEGKDIPDQPGKSRLDVLIESFVGILEGINNVNVGLMTFNSGGGPVRYPIGYIDGDASQYETGGFKH
jgi:type IV pilus assembly protein PilY1